MYHESVGGKFLSTMTSTTVRIVQPDPYEVSSLILWDTMNNSEIDLQRSTLPIANKDEVRLNNWWALLVFILILITATGNILVCMAIAWEKRLQNVTNYFLMSMAVTDLMVAVLVMPLGTLTLILGYWPLGVVWCNVYVTCDVLACSASIMHMCFISLGRYLGIRNPIRTRHTCTKRIVGFKIAAVWLLAMLVSSCITILGIINPSNIMPRPKICTINNRGFLLLASFVAFYIPMIVMVATYVLTVQLLRKNTQFTADENQFRGLKGRYFCSKTLSTESSSSTMTSTTAVTKSSTSSSTKLNRASGSNAEKERSLGGRTRKRSLDAAEQKASKVLGLVFCTFVLCWSPFFLFNNFFLVCPTCSISTNVSDTFLWLGYSSSTINPIIYTIFNKTFRDAFIRLLKCKCSRFTNSSKYRPVMVNRRKIGYSRQTSLSTPDAFPLTTSFQSTSLLTQTPISMPTPTSRKGGLLHIDNTPNDVFIISRHVPVSRT